MQTRTQGPERREPPELSSQGVSLGHHTPLLLAETQRPAGRQVLLWEPEGLYHTLPFSWTLSYVQICMCSTKARAEFLMEAPALAEAFFSISTKMATMNKIVALCQQLSYSYSV
jgi:hypothetical protein